VFRSRPDHRLRPRHEWPGLTDAGHRALASYALASATNRVLRRNRSAVRRTLRFLVEVYLQVGCHYSKQRRCLLAALEAEGAAGSNARDRG
jgi:hypothetical protein